MQYALLFYANEREREHASEAELAALREARARYVAELDGRGGRASFHGLETTAAATTVRLRDGRALLHDGPAAEVRETLVGLLLVEARDLHEAIPNPGRAPEARLGALNSRAVGEML